MTAIYIYWNWLSPNVYFNLEPKPRYENVASLLLDTPPSYVQITDGAYPLACELERSLGRQCFGDVASALTATLMKESVKK